LWEEEALQFVGVSKKKGTARPSPEGKKRSRVKRLGGDRLVEKKKKGERSEEEKFVTQKATEQRPRRQITIK